MSVEADPPLDGSLEEGCSIRASRLFSLSSAVAPGDVPSAPIGQLEGAFTSSERNSVFSRRFPFIAVATVSASLTGGRGQKNRFGCLVLGRVSFIRTGALIPAALDSGHDAHRDREFTPSGPGTCQSNPLGGGRDDQSRYSTSGHSARIGRRHGDWRPCRPPRPMPQQKVSDVACGKSKKAA